LDNNSSTDGNIISLEEREQRQFDKYCKMNVLPSSKERGETLNRWIEEGLRASTYVLREKAEALTEISVLMELILTLEGTPGHNWSDKELAAKLLERSAEVHDLAKRLLEAAIREEKRKLSYRKKRPVLERAVNRALCAVIASHSMGNAWL
jgi:hypothetical protein